MSFRMRYGSAKFKLPALWFGVFFFLWSGVFLQSQTNFIVGIYNVEKYELEKNEEFANKSRKTVQSICQMNADVLGLVEMGSLASTAYLLDELNRCGMDYSHCEWMPSNDGRLNLVIFSRYPLKEIVYHTRDKYELDERSYSLRRGILEATVEVTDDYSFTVLLTHLKSLLESTKLDQQEVRLEEAKLLRGKVEKILNKDPEADFVVMGDLNDHYSSLPIRTILGTPAGKKRLLDARPIEQIGDSLPEERTRGKFRSVAWTYFYSKEDTYSRLDYILYSPGLKAQFQPEETRVVVVPNWGVASDHRPIRAGFTIPVEKRVQNPKTTVKSSLKPALK